MTATYEQAIRVARDLIEVPTECPEYARGQVALIADLWGRPGVFHTDRMLEVAADIAATRGVSYRIEIMDAVEASTADDVCANCGGERDTCPLCDGTGKERI